MKIRKYVQAIFFLSSVYLCVFFIVFLNKIQAGNFSMTKPGGVEGFLPISAFMAFKKFIMTGNYDWVHPAGLSLFIIFILITAVFKRSFCGYVCPVGFVSELVSSVGLKRQMNRYAAYVLSALKYILFAFFAYTIISMPVQAMDVFLNAPYNIVADAKMFEFFRHPGTYTLVFIGLMFVLTAVYSGFWCRFLCPYGVLHSVFGMLSPFFVKRNPEACTNCLQCTKACPMDIQVHTKKAVLHADCIGCHDCVRARTNDKCLSVGKNYDTKKLAYIVGVAVIVMIIVFMAAGLWNSHVSSAEYAKWYGSINQLSH